MTVSKQLCIQSTGLQGWITVHAQCLWRRLLIQLFEPPKPVWVLRKPNKIKQKIFIALEDL